MTEPGPSLSFAPILEKVKGALPPGLPAHLVGGAVRDFLLQRPTHDLDFVLPGDVIPLARQVARKLDAAFYPLDSERDTGRVILQKPDGSRFFLDFAAYRGPTLEADLRARDFSINAIALPLAEPETLFDPLGGAEDLRLKRIRACSPDSLINDPIRVLRAVRLAVALGFMIEVDTQTLMRQAAPLMEDASVERLRDELFKILDGLRSETAIAILDRMDCLYYVLPEMQALKDVSQSAPHTLDVWGHTLAVLQNLGNVLEILSPNPRALEAANWGLGMVSVRLGRYRPQIQEHLSTQLNPERSLRSLLVFAALYHDIGKPETRRQDESGRLRFFEHEIAGAAIIGRRARRLHLSNDEIERLQQIVRHHLRPMLLAQGSAAPSRRAIYRFFRAAGPAGVDICLLSLADVLGTYGSPLPQDAWRRHLDVVRALLEAWFEHREESVAPAPLLNGRDLMEVFQLPQGRQIGVILDALLEAQAEGKVTTRDQALAFVDQELNQFGPD